MEVQLAKRTVGPVEVRLSTKRAADHGTARCPRPAATTGWNLPASSSRKRPVNGERLRSAWPATGRSCGARAGESARSINLPEALRRKDVTAGFEYFAQPSSLMARLVPRKTRIGVEPEYVVLVDSDQVRLEARLRYTVRGAKVFAVDIAMPDWQIDEVGPDSVVAIDGVPTGMSGPMLSLPLASPTIGPFEIRLKAHRPLPAEAKSFSLALPQPQASAPAAAVVAVLPADNVEIMPDSQATTGLLRQQAAVPLELPSRQQEPLFYRSDAPKAVFAAELRRHRQKITASVASRVTMDPAGGRVEQKFAYSIAYEPTDYFLLEVPRELGAKGRLVLNYEDQVLAPVVLGEEADDGAKPLRMRVALPKACIGPCEITARYSLSPPADRSGPRREHPRAAGHAAGRGTCRQQRLGHPGRRAASRSRSRRLDGGRGRTGPGGFAADAGIRRRATHAEIVLKLRGERRRCGRRGRPGVDPDLPDQIDCRGPPGSRRAATHHAAARTGDHVARRGRPRTGLRAVERNARQSADAGRAGPDRPLVRRRRAAALRAQPAISFPRAAGLRSRVGSDEVRVSQPGRRRLGPPRLLATSPAARGTPGRVAARIDRGIRLGLEQLLLRPAARAQSSGSGEPGSVCAIRAARPLRPA